MVLGLVPSLIAVRQGVLSELTETANATMALDQSYGFTGQTLGCGDNARGNATLDRNGNRNGKTNPVLEQATRIGAVDGRGGRADRNGSVQDRDGSQAFVAGSSFVEGRHFGDNKSIPLKSTAPTTSNANQKPCD
jgi:hypothetical protein